MSATSSGTSRRPRSVRRRAGRATTAVTACAGLALALTACGGSDDPDAGTNGVGKLSAAKIQQKTVAAAESANSVHVTGKLVSGRSTYELDMQLAQNGGKGTVGTKDTEFSLLRIDRSLWVKADADFWAHQKDAAPSKSDNAAAAKLDGKYVKVPAEDRTYKQFSGFTEKESLLETLLSLHGSLSRGAHGELDGTRTIRIAAAQGNGGTLDVSLKGEPYPLRLQRAGGAGVVRFADWGTHISLERPADNQVVDYGENLGSGN
ncbi:hypothetical protein [Streptomyces niger]|uniref:hypothetical protein n=1 Tax=Streptomyces niger TaxID=66373 RepID=UPI00069A02D5|nr:hypothetical protein [Streptomyces niger]